MATHRSPSRWVCAPRAQGDGGERVVLLCESHIEQTLVLGERPRSPHVWSHSSQTAACLYRKGNKKRKHFFWCLGLFSFFFLHFSMQNIYRGSTLNSKEMVKGQQMKNAELPTASFMRNQTAFTLLWVFQWSYQVSLLLLKSWSLNTIEWPFCALPV